MKGKIWRRFCRRLVNCLYSTFWFARQSIKLINFGLTMENEDFSTSAMKRLLDSAVTPKHGLGEGLAKHHLGRVAQGDKKAANDSEYLTANNRPDILGTPVVRDSSVQIQTLILLFLRFGGYFFAFWRKGLKSALSQCWRGSSLFVPHRPSAEALTPSHY